MHRIGRVSLSDVDSAAKKYLKRFENPDNSLLAITCGPTDIADVKDEFDNKFKFSVSNIEDIENSVFG